jgi:hypothetical protein
MNLGAEMNSGHGVQVARERSFIGRWGASALIFAARAAAIVALAGFATLAGCTNRSDKVFPVVQGPGLQPPHAPNFGAAQAIDPTPSTSPSATVFDPSRHVAIASSGDGLIIFKADDGTGVIRLYAVRHLAGQGVTSPFTTPVVIDAGVGTSVDAAQLALDSNGDGVIVFSQPFQGIRRAYARIFNGSTGQFQSPVSIDTGGSNTLSEDVTSVAGAALANGDILLAFSEADDVFAVKYTKASGTFSTPFQVDSLGNVGNTVTALRAQARGNAGQLSWLQDSDTSGGVNRVLFVSRHSTSGSRQPQHGRHDQPQYRHGRAGLRDDDPVQWDGGGGLDPGAERRRHARVRPYALRLRLAQHGRRPGRDDRRHVRRAGDCRRPAGDGGGGDRRAAPGARVRYRAALRQPAHQRHVRVGPLPGGRHELGCGGQRLSACGGGRRRRR